MQSFLPKPDGRTWICSGKTFWPHHAQELFDTFRLQGLLFGEERANRQASDEPLQITGATTVGDARFLDKPTRLVLPPPDSQMWVATGYDDLHRAGR